MRKKQKEEKNKQINTVKKDNIAKKKSFFYDPIKNVDSKRIFKN